MVKQYKKRSRITDKKFRDILKLFLLDIEATKVSDISNIFRPASNRIFTYIRTIIAEYCEETSIFETGEIEIDESYFGASRVKGKRGRGARGKTPVFGLLKRDAKVYTQIVKNCSKSVLMPIIEELASKDSVIFSDGFKSYDGIVDYGFKHHYRVIHSQNEFAKGNNISTALNNHHINGIENFWGLCKVRLAKFRGMHEGTFYLHIKECEFRFNNRKKSKNELYLFTLKLIRNYNKKKIIVS
jgi:transposase